MGVLGEQSHAKHAKYAKGRNDRSDPLLCFPLAGFANFARDPSWCGVLGEESHAKHAKYAKGRNDFGYLCRPSPLQGEGKGKVWLCAGSSSWVRLLQACLRPDLPNAVGINSDLHLTSFAAEPKARLPRSGRHLPKAVSSPPSLQAVPNRMHRSGHCEQGRRRGVCMRGRVKSQRRFRTSGRQSSSPSRGQ